MNRRTVPIMTVGTLLVAALWVVEGRRSAPSPMAREASGAEQLDDRFARLGGVIQRAMADLDVPGVAVGVLTDGDTRTAGFGVTSTVNPLEVTHDTLFQIGSITKTMTATAIMRLVDQGKVDLDAPVQTYLPAFRLRDAEATEHATVRHLLTHTGGWVGDYFVPSGEGDDALARMIEQMAELEQLAPLGSTWSYNNSGFYTAGRIIEVLEGAGYEAAMRTLVFEPLGLDRIYFGPADVMTHRFSVGHLPSREGARVAEPWALFRAMNPAGGAVGSVTQLLNYASFHLGDGTNETGETILTQGSLLAMHAPQATRIDAAEQMGLGWYLSDVEDTRILSHEGVTHGQVGRLLLVPESEFAMAILTNSILGEQLTREVSRWVLAEYLDVIVDGPTLATMAGDDLADYVGLYQRPMADVEVVVELGQLRLRRTLKQGFPTRDSPLPPPGPSTAFGLYAVDRIVQLEGAARGEFVRRPDGSVGWLRLGERLHVKQ